MGVKEVLTMEEELRTCGEDWLSTTPVLWFNFNSKSRMRRIETHKPAQVDA